MLLTAAAPDAVAHPFGFPPVVIIAVEGGAVTLLWSVDSRSADDAAALAVHLGLVEEPPEGRLMRLTPAQDRELSRSSLLVDYLEEHLAVAVDGGRCSPEARPRPSFTRDGAAVVFECSDIGNEIEVEVTMLQDLDLAYRTVGFASEDLSPRRAIFTSASPSRTFVVSGSDEPRGEGAFVAAGAFVLATIFGAALLLRRRR